MYWRFATLPYLVIHADAGNVLKPVRDSDAVRALVPEDKGAVFIVIAERREELNVIRQAVLGGRL